MLDYILNHIMTAQHFQGVDVGAVGGFIGYRLIKDSARRVLKKIEMIVVIYIAAYLGYLACTSSIVK